MTSATPPSLFPYQQRVLSNWSDRRALAVLPYGSGKSRIAATLAVDHIGSDTNSTDFRVVAVVFCRPRNVGTWRREWCKWYPQVQVFTTDTLEALEQQLQDDAVAGTFTPTVLLVPHHQMRTQFEGLMRFIRTWSPGSLILDESTRIKYPKTQMTERAIQLSESAAPDCRRMAFTGRAMPESPENIWSQFAFVYPRANPLGSSFYGFQRKWFLKTDYGYALRLDLQHAFDALIARHTHTFTAEDHEELRRVVGDVRVQYVLEQYEESAEQRKLLDHLYTTWSLPADPQENEEAPFDTPLTEAEMVEYNHAMSILQKAQQIASGFYYTPDHTPRYLDKNPKLTLCIEVLEQLLAEDPQRRIIIWQLYEAERHMLALALQGAGIRHVFGPSEEALRVFMAGDTEGFKGPSVIVMPATITEGFNELVGADTEIFYSQSYSQEMRDQAEARIKRIGQTASTITYIDLASARLADMEVIVALQAKAFTPERARAIVRKHLTKEISQ